MQAEGQRTTDGLDRRSFLKRAAIVGGATVWAAPTVQSLMAPAFATGTAECPPDRVVRFKFDVNDSGTGGVFNSGDATGNGAEWCLPTGYATAPILVVQSAVPNVGTFVVDGVTYSITIVLISGKTAQVILPPGFRVEDLHAKAGAPGEDKWGEPKGECDDMDGVSGDTATVTLEEKGISFVAGVLCPPPPQQP